MNRKYIYPLVIIIVTVALYYADDFSAKDKKAAPQTSNAINRNSEVFDDFFLPSSTTGVIIAHNFFTLSYSETHEQAEWVAYKLSDKDLVKNDFDRPYFIEDKSVKTKSADWRNYKNSGYDRGHLCPAADRGFSYDAYKETFLTSNISPQNHEFNAGIWNRLEQKVRFWAEKYEGVYVVTGGVLQGDMKAIGYENVSVPNTFYKIVMDVADGEYKTIAFLIPNKNVSGSYYNYVVSIDEIEAKTGIDFFPNLPDAIENDLEKKVHLKAWGRK